MELYCRQFNLYKYLSEGSKVKMKVLFLCGVFGKEYSEFIEINAKRPVEYSANIFQEKLIKGFKENKYDFNVVSAPFIGSYPNGSRIFKFKEFNSSASEYRYISFNNIWGIRNFSRAIALKKALKSFINDSDNDKRIIVYSPHTPFLDAAVYAKKCDPSIKICLIVPDLPQYMNLDARISLAYRIGKKYDINRFNHLNKEVDSYLLLTEAMKEKIDIHGRPYLVVEGIIDTNMLSRREEMLRNTVKSVHEKYVVYTGKLNERFGVKDLVDAFITLEQPEYRLVLCGKGDLEKYIIEKSKTDSRIMYIGQVSPEEAEKWIYRAHVLVNPRKNDEEYTKYSFPSKNIEYLLTGNPVVGYMLDGMPQKYNEFLHVPIDGDLAKTIFMAINSYYVNNEYTEYAIHHLLSNEIVEMILRL